MTERDDALRDHAFADGMQLALAMCHQGAFERAERVCEQLRRESLKVLRRRDCESEDRK